MMTEYQGAGHLELRVLPNWGNRVLSSEFSALLDNFLMDIARSGRLTPLTQITVRQQTKRFLFSLEDAGHFSFKQITPLITNDTTVKIARAYNGGISAIVFSVRLFLKYVFEQQLTALDLSESVPRLVAPKTIIREGFSSEEATALLESAQQNALSAKRDYAIMLFAAVTGIRAIDIAHLKRENIDWRSNEIRLVQHKTGKQLTLPLTTEVGNAIADYLLHERPAFNDPHIFLCARRPYRPVDSRSVVNIVHRHLKKTGVAKTSPTKKLGVHSFRRALGKRLLTTETPLPMISEILGHVNSDSSRTYLSIHEQELKKCALPLIPAKQGAGL
jgi:integrase